jgi:hypothetical protein
MHVYSYSYNEIHTSGYEEEMHASQVHSAARLDFAWLFLAPRFEVDG